MNVIHPIDPTTAEPAELPSQNDKMRDAIKEVVGKLAADISKNLADLRSQIDAMEQLIVENSQRVTENLTEHANICGGVQQEIARLHGVIEIMRQQTVSD